MPSIDNPDVRSVENKKRFVTIFHNPMTAWIILFVSIVLTAVAYLISSKFVRERTMDRFQFRANEIEHAIKDRLSVYEQVLWSGVGLMYASDNVTRKEFAKFVETVDIDNQWPGIQGIGFSVPVKPEDKQAHIDEIRGEGFPDFTIRPEGKRDLYSSIIYLEPFDWRNKRAFGFDMWSNDMRRAAMMRARDEGVAATSGIITLVQETEKDVQRGFLTYVPVYKSKTTPEAVKERKDEFLGWVYAAFRAGNLMQGIIGTEDPNIEFEVYDGEEMNKESLLFDSNNSLHLLEPDHEPDLKKAVHVTLQGRPWAIYFNTPKEYMVSADQNVPRYVVTAGIIVDLLLFYVIYSLYFINSRAEEIAAEKTKELEQTKLGLEEQVANRTSELQKAQDELEIKVEKRTVDLNTANEQLIEREAEIRAIADNLDKNEKLQRFWLNETTDGLWDWNLVTNEEYLSPKFKSEFGYEDHEIPNSVEGWQKVIFPEDLPKAIQAFKDHTEKGKAYNLPVRYRHKNGSTVWVICRGVGIKDKSGRYIRMIGTHMNITPMKEMEEQLINTTSELQRSNEELAKFAYVSSHDLKAPLRAIDNLSKWISEDLNNVMTNETREQMTLLRGRVCRMEKLLDDLLAYSRAGRVKGDVKMVDVKAIIDETADLLNPPKEFSVKCVSTMPNLETFGTPLEQVFRNLIGNSIKHGNVPAGKVEISAQEKDSFCEFTISDDGPGIPKEFHNKIFQMFQTLKPRDEVEGSGMGLAIVKKLVEANGGTISIDSSESGGAAFRFTWPKKSIG